MSMMKDAPPTVIVYQSCDTDLLDIYAIVFPDGSVFSMSEEPDSEDGFCRFEGSYSLWIPQENDMIVNSVPESVYDKIVSLMA